MVIKLFNFLIQSVLTPEDFTDTVTTKGEVGGKVLYILDFVLKILYVLESSMFSLALASLHQAF